MNSLILAIAAFVLYIIAYHTYGKYLGSKIFKLDSSVECPSKVLQDDIDYVPTKRPILFGHHFASIAGTGPIVGPAIAVIWGWMPALVWVVLGSIFMGAVHDFGAMVVSMRNQGRSIGDITKDLISSRVRFLFLLIIFFLLWLVVAIFGVVIAVVFDMFPQSVLPVWFELPIALILGYWVYKKDYNHKIAGLVAVFIMYITVVIGAYIPLKMPGMFGLSPVAIWVIILLIYAYIASVLPVQTLLQPRDYINGHELFVAMSLLFIGLIIAHPVMSSPTINLAPAGAPPIWPMLFVIVACGAISGFHSLVSSGTSSKQCHNETDTLPVGYGGMLMEGVLAVLVIIACAAGLGMALTTKDGEILTGISAFNSQYVNWGVASGMKSAISAFIIGSANMIESIGIPREIILSVMGVFVASFASTTLDTATRLQRYVVAEIATAAGVPSLAKKHPATVIAVGSALVLAFYNGKGTGALTLWPLFGATNQLLAGLALLVITIFLAKKKVAVIYTLIPMIFMIFMTGWAMIINLTGYYAKSNWVLFIICFLTIILEIWMIIESIIVFKTVYGKSTSAALT